MRAVRLLPLLLLAGCAREDFPILFPSGPVAALERDLLLVALALMMIVVVPVYLMTWLFVRRYRMRPSSRPDDPGYWPNWDYSWRIDAAVWGVPALIVAVMAGLVLYYTNRLDPYRAEGPEGADPLRVQVVAQDWKWLFLYPDHGIASLNELAFPADRPLALDMTSDTVMTSFAIPALGGQIYVMAGMETELHLVADGPGTFRGRNTQYSGEGFAHMHFEARAMTDEAFEAWLRKARMAPALDLAAYDALRAPSVDAPPRRWGALAPDLFETIIARYRAPLPEPPESLAEMEAN